MVIVAKILLLDDNETILKIVSSVLNSKSHKVILAKDPLIVKPINPEVLSAKVQHWLTVATQLVRQNSDFKNIKSAGKNQFRS